MGRAGEKAASEYMGNALAQQEVQKWQEFGQELRTVLLAWVPCRYDLCKLCEL